MKNFTGNFGGADWLGLSGSKAHRTGYWVSRQAQDIGLRDARSGSFHPCKHEKWKNSSLKNGICDQTGSGPLNHRIGRSGKIMNKNPHEKQPGPKMHIRKLKQQDRDRIEEMVIASGNFNDVEIATALELVDDALEEGEKSGYIFTVLADGKEHASAHGYACYGPVPLTQGAWDLYWIVIDQAAQRKGLGRLLLEYVEGDVVKRGGRMLLIETSSQETYSATIRFYEKNGYQLVARIRNFYRIGDDKLVFQKELV
jgi:ribosomal protein S18 acetylase RimI-like enzyme